MRKETVLWGIIILLFCTVAVLSYIQFFGSSEATGSHGYDAPVAKVGEHWITKSELTERLIALYGEETLQEIINRKIVFQEAERLGIHISEDEIWRELNHFKQGYDSDEAFQRALKEQVGITEEDLRQEILYYLYIEEMATQDIVISDAEIEEYYEKNIDAFYEPTRFHLHRIIVETEEEAWTVIREIEEGSSFEAVAQERSIDMITASSGGDLGIVTSNDFFIDSQVLTTAETLPLNELSEPLETEEGFTIIKVTERMEGHQATLDEVRDIIRRELAINQVDSLESFIAQLREQVGVEILLFD